MHRYQHGSMYSYQPPMQYIAAFHAYYIIQGKLRHAFSMLPQVQSKPRTYVQEFSKIGYKKEVFKPPLSCLPKAINRQPIFRSVALLITY